MVVFYRKTIDYYRLSAKPLNKTFSISENSGYRLSAILHKLDVGRIMKSILLRQELLDNPEFISVMQSYGTYLKMENRITDFQIFN
jgi:CRISPR/Cas system Type II protein with McrA/HNH and RuvC-like nuclease domain